MRSLVCIECSASYTSPKSVTLRLRGLEVRQRGAAPGDLGREIFAARRPSEPLSKERCVALPGAHSPLEEREAVSLGEGSTAFTAWKDGKDCRIGSRTSSTKGSIPPDPSRTGMTVWFPSPVPSDFHVAALHREHSASLAACAARAGMTCSCSSPGKIAWENSPKRWLRSPDLRDRRRLRCAMRAADELCRRGRI